MWQSAWPRADVASIASLYASGVVFYSHPFRERQAPTEYVDWAFSDQTAAECRFGDPIVDGSRAAVDWWAVVTSTDGTQQSLAGTSLLVFDARGLVVEQRDAWCEAGGRSDPADWARPG